MNQEPIVFDGALLTNGLFSDRSADNDGDHVDSKHFLNTVCYSTFFEIHGSGRYMMVPQNGASLWYE